MSHLTTRRRTRPVASWLTSCYWLSTQESSKPGAPTSDHKDSRPTTKHKQSELPNALMKLCAISYMSDSSRNTSLTLSMWPPSSQNVLRRLKRLRSRGTGIYIQGALAHLLDIMADKKEPLDWFNCHDIPTTIHYDRWFGYVCVIQHQKDSLLAKWQELAGK